MILIFFDNLLLHERIGSHMKSFLCIVFVLLTSPVFSQLRLPAIFSDHMILQRDKPVKIWGSANAGEMVHIAIGTVNESSPGQIGMAIG